MDERTFVTRSGKVLELRPVAQYTLAQASLVCPAPEPPLEEIAEGQFVANTGNKDYQAAVAKWHQDLEPIAQATYIDFGVKRFSIPAEDLELVKITRETLSGPPYYRDVKQSDWVIYITHILLGNVNEVSALIDKIIALSMPTAAQVEAQLDSFPIDLEGGRSLVNQSTPVAAQG